MSRVDREALDQLATFFSNLFEETQMTDVDEIINAVKKAESEEEIVNLQIEETNKEIEILEQSIADEKKRMSGLKQLTPEEMDKLKEANRLEDQIHKNEELMRNYDKKMSAISNNLKSFKVETGNQEGLPPILDLLEIGEDVRKLDGQGQLQISEYNIAYLMEILGEVEHKVDELFYVYKQLKLNDDPSKVERFESAWFNVSD
jgi:chromosome segregation ATPase